MYEAGDEVGFQVQYPSQRTVGDVLRDEYCLSRSLVSRYEAILFLMHHRFNITSSAKKKQPVYSLRDYEFVAVIILNAWCVRAPFQPIITSRNQSLEGFESPPLLTSTGVVGSNGSLITSGTPLAGAHAIINSGDSFSPFELDATLFARFRDLRLRATQLSSDVWTALSSLIESSAERKRIESRFKIWFRALIQCAAGRDLKDFFEDITSGVIEPLIEMRCDIDRLFELMDRAVNQALNYADVQVWSALMTGMRPCIFRLLSTHPQRFLGLSSEVNDQEDDAG